MDTERAIAILSGFIGWIDEYDADTYYDPDSWGQQNDLTQEFKDRMTAWVPTIERIAAELEPEVLRHLRRGRGRTRSS